ncbi:hypothetical protein SANA_13960 [Gottschalkiaceae bacterium SANA]|nr:hypothetical protein SANA_13960 [Gottschalkiaceae bacterium SANA]
MDIKPARVCSQDMEFNQEPFILGRENEIEEIVKDFDKVLEGEFGVCLIHGEAGVGKTHLVSNVARREAQI